MLRNKSWSRTLVWNLNTLLLFLVLAVGWYIGTQYNENYRIVRVKSKILQMTTEDIVIIQTMTRGVVKPRVKLLLDIPYSGVWHRNQIKDFISDTPVNYTVGDDYTVDILVYKNLYYRIATADDPVDHTFGGFVVGLCVFGMLIIAESALAEQLNWKIEEKTQ
jgi:hypothetical protein